MRKLPIIAAVKHALSSVFAYRGTGLRIGALWIVVLLALNFAGEIFAGDPAAPRTAGAGALALLQFAVNVLAMSSIAVNWNRFVLRDEVPSPANVLRLDQPVWRYAGNSLLIALLTFLPVGLFIAIVSSLVPAAVILALPAVVLAGTASFMLSVKLPAVALGREDFGLADALKACEGNFWQVMGVVVLGSLIALALLLVLIAIVILMQNLPRAVGLLVQVPVGAVVNLFLILFSVSMLTSLYGFFVERRDF